MGSLCINILNTMLCFNWHRYTDANLELLNDGNYGWSLYPFNHISSIHNFLLYQIAWRINYNPLYMCMRYFITMQLIWNSDLRSTQLLSCSYKRRTYSRVEPQGAALPYHSLPWRHHECDGVSNHHPHACLLNRLFRRRSKKFSGDRWMPRTKAK